MDEKITSASAATSLLSSNEVTDRGTKIKGRISYFGAVCLIILCLWPVALRGYEFGETPLLRILAKLGLPIIISARIGYILFKHQSRRRSLRHIATVSGALTAILVGFSIRDPELWRFTQWTALWAALVATCFSHLHRREPSFFGRSS